MNNKIECEFCIRLKEMTNELDLLRLENQFDNDYYKKRLLQMKKENDDLRKENEDLINQLESIEKIFKKERK